MQYEEIGVDPFKRVVYNFKRRKTISKYRNDIWGIDLMDMSKTHPGGYLLVCIDYFTRYVRAEIMKTKSKKDFDVAMEKLLFQDVKDDDKITLPKHIHSDLESAFIHSSILPKHKINIYHTEFMGSPICERVIRSIKEIIYRLIYDHKIEMHKNNVKHYVIFWTHYVADAVYIYNNRIHRSIEMTPLQAWNLSNEDDEDAVPLILQQANNFSRETFEKPKLKKGDQVVTAKDENYFKKSYKSTSKWNTTVYTVKRINYHDLITYTLSNNKTYYIQQLQKVKESTT